MTNEAPTINEIVYNTRHVEPRDFSFSTGHGKYLKNQRVRFMVNRTLRQGRITGYKRKGVEWLYGIETDSGVWHRGIPETDIINKITET